MPGVNWRLVVVTATIVAWAALVGPIGPVAATSAPQSTATRNVSRAGSPSQRSSPQAAPVRHAVIVSIDGLRPDLLMAGPATRMQRFLRQGSYTMRARTVTEGYTVPSHVSMLTGVVPSRHGVTWDQHIEDSYPEVPTIFELAKQAGRTTAIAVGKSKLIVLTKPGSLDWSYVGNEDDTTDADTARQAAAIIRAHRPDLLFVHFGQFDVAGHASGWGSAAQQQALARADDAFGVVEDALSAAGMLDSAVRILTADHGGDGLLHDPENPLSQLIPWAAAGPGVRRGVDLDRAARAEPVTTMSTFATVCLVLGLSPTVAIDGRAVAEIFTGR